MKVIEKVEIEALGFPVDGYHYNCKILRSVDGGETFWCCGSGKYFKTFQEAQKFKSEYEAKA